MVLDEWWVDVSQDCCEGARGGQTRKQSAVKDEFADAAVMGNAERDKDADELLK